MLHQIKQTEKKNQIGKDYWNAKRILIISKGPSFEVGENISQLDNGHCCLVAKVVLTWLFLESIEFLPRYLVGTFGEIRLTRVLLFSYEP